MKSIEFGFLQKPLRADFLGVSITPLDNHGERLEAIKKASNIDGYYYPPQVSIYTADLLTRESIAKIPRSEKPADVYFFASSHTISIKNPISTEMQPATDWTLIIYLLAYIYGTRLQPSELKFEGRIPIKPVNHFVLNDKTCVHFLTHVYSWWLNLPTTLRIQFVNILYVYTRATSLYWEWDAFLNQYMVFDALFKLHTYFDNNDANIKHKKRFKLLCNKYTLFNAEITDKLYKVRNNLFHEAMWMDSTIGFGSPDKDAHQLPYHLSRLNSRLICGITGYSNNYTDSPWWYMGNFGFDEMRN